MGSACYATMVKKAAATAFTAMIRRFIWQSLVLSSRYFISTIIEIFSRHISPARSTTHNTYPTDLTAHWQVKKDFSPTI